jgi:hypothetical protein
MTSILFKLAMLFGSLASSGFVAVPLAIVSSSQPFQLDGHPVTTAGITSWPVVAGDALTTAKFPAVLHFHDGSSVQLSAQSSVTLSGSEEEPKLLLTGGKLDYNLVAGSKIAITNAAVATPGAKRTLLGSLTNLVSGVPVSSVKAAESSSAFPDALAARLPPISIFQ